MRRRGVRVRRPEILALFETHVYGRSPRPCNDGRHEVTAGPDSALDGAAVRTQVRVYFSADTDGPHMDMLVYLPADASRPTPTFVALNFSGNHAIHPDPGIRLSTSWMRPSQDGGVVANRATADSRGSQSSRWPVEEILSRGYGLATIYYGDIDPDYDDAFQNDVHALFYEPGQRWPSADEWGAIAAWAWGLSRAMDYFEVDDEIDHDRVAVMGHSRLGKAALWAGATDERFAVVVSNNSGCGGAALSRRGWARLWRGSTTRSRTGSCDNFEAYNDNEDALPVD